MENHHLKWVDQLEMAIFNSYLGLLEDTLDDNLRADGSLNN